MLHDRVWPKGGAQGPTHIALPWGMGLGRPGNERGQLTSIKYMKERCILLLCSEFSGSHHMHVLAQDVVRALILYSAHS